MVAGCPKLIDPFCCILSIGVDRFRICAKMIDLRNCRVHYPAIDDAISSHVGSYYQSFVCQSGDTHGIVLGWKFKEKYL
jgi:hypothetical protein